MTFQGPQFAYQPDVETMLGRRIDYLFTFDKGTSDKQLCWCQGKVIKVGANTNKPNTVKMLWDPMPDSDKYKESLTSTVDVLPVFWNKDKDQSWRLDIDLAVMAEDGENKIDKSKNIKEGESENNDKREGSNEFCENEYSKDNY